MDLELCSRCGWPVGQPFEIVSRHRTSEGVVTWTRCPCGQLRVAREGAAAAPSTEVVAERAVRSLPVRPSEPDDVSDPGPVPAAGSPPVPADRPRVGSLSAPGPVRPRARAVAAAVLLALGGVLGALTVTHAPPPVLVACVALAAVSGLLSGVWGWLAQSRAPAAAATLGLRGALVGGTAGALLVGFVKLFGPATVVVLPAGYLVAAALVWPAGWPAGQGRGGTVPR
jgi:hypothetical protein